MSKTNSNLKNIALLISTFLVMIIFCEAVLRALDIPKYSSVPELYRQPSDVMHNALIPDSYGKIRNNEFDVEYKINSLGLRDVEIGPKQKYRILMLGDSNTEGFGVNMNDTIAKQLESMLAKKGFKVEAINAGIAGYSPILEYLYLKNEGILLNPDMVILNLDLNDIKDDYDYEKIAMWNGSEAVAVPGSKQEKTWVKNVEHVCTKYDFHFCMFFGMTFFKFMGKYKTEEPYEGLVPGDINTDRMFITRFNISDPSIHYERTFKYVRKIKDFCDEKNTTFVLVTYPYGHLVNEREWVIGRKRFYLDEFPVYSLDYFSRVKKFAKSNGITYIDTYYKFNSTKTFPLFYSYDPHLTKEGSRMVALGIFENLKLNSST